MTPAVSAHVHAALAPYLRHFNYSVPEDPAALVGALAASFTAATAAAAVPASAEVAPVLRSPSAHGKALAPDKSARASVGSLIAKSKKMGKSKSSGKWAPNKSWNNGRSSGENEAFRSHGGEGGGKGKPRDSIVEYWEPPGLPMS
jgi:hypothetical protein